MIDRPVTIAEGDRIALDPNGVEQRQVIAGAVQARRDPASGGEIMAVAALIRAAGQIRQVKAVLAPVGNGGLIHHPATGFAVKMAECFRVQGLAADNCQFREVAIEPTAAIHLADQMLVGGHDIGVEILRRVGLGREIRDPGRH